jgi:hypothetical protein
VEDCALELVEGAIVVPTREQVAANACLRRALATRRRQTMAESPPPNPSKTFRIRTLSAGRLNSHYP